MSRSMFWMGSIAVLLSAIIADSALARGFGGGGFRGGGGMGGGFRGGGGGFGGGGFGGGMPRGNFGGGGGFNRGGAGLSGGGFRPNIPSTPRMPTGGGLGGGGLGAGGLGGGGLGGLDRGGLGGGGLGGGGLDGNALKNSDLMHRPQLPGGGSGLGIGDRPQLRPDGGITRPDLGNLPNIRPGDGGLSNLPGDGSRLDGLRPGGGDGTASLPGLGPSRPGAGGAGTRFPGLGGGDAGSRLPNVRPGADGAGSRLPGLGAGASAIADRLPGTRLGEGGAGERWDLADRGSLPERQQDLASRFNDLDEHWGDRDWAHQQWEGPNGGKLNHFGFWGPNGYWGHTGVWGPNGGHWGHTGHIGPNGAWGHTGYFGPAGHWSRSWGWYNGYCPVWGHCHWGYIWDEYPVAAAFGATMWGINCVNWAYGISAYYNPYYDDPVYVNNQVVVSYNEPIVGNPNYETDQSSDSSGSSDPLTETFNQAREAFYNGDYQQALKLTNQCLQTAPEDAAINEFRALCLFALGEYRQAAANIHAVLAAGPGWNWTTLISLYKNPKTYTDQLRQLESYVNSNPDAAGATFLLAYHYLTAGHEQDAVEMWKRVAEIEPDDQLTQQFIKMYSPAPDTASSTAKSSPPPDLEKPAYPLEKLEGDWKASDDSGEFLLHLGKDSFTWTFDRDGNAQTVEGAYVVRGNNLVMQPNSGGTMLSTITLSDDNTLDFTPIGNAHDLTFTKTDSNAS